MSKNTFQDKLLETFKLFSDKIAIEYNDNSIKYSQLDQKTNKIANYILQKGIQQNSLISILVEDKVEVISLIIGILKAGCIFVPIDPANPAKRIEYIINSTETEVLFWDENSGKREFNFTNKQNSKIQTILINEDFYNNSLSDEYKQSCQYCSDDPIYIYFTSGSTGNPKAIVGRNESLLHFIEWEIAEFAINQNTRISQFTSPSFDAFLRDIFVPLFAGGTVCIPVRKEIILDTASMVDWIEKNKVNIIHCTPSLFRVFSAGTICTENFKDLNYVFMAGEVLKPNDLENWYSIFGDRIQLVNFYGASETTMIKMFYPIKSSDVKRKSIPIGKPIKGAKAVILDKNLNICNQGDIGEIYIRTPYRTLGYYKNPDLNKEKFIINPFNKDPNDLIYRTGDLGRLLESGDIEFLGRIDRQIKIRGIRVELGEIEKELSKFTGIKKCVVDFRNDSKNVEEKAKAEYCKKCGITTRFPEAVLDTVGYCKICNDYETYKSKAQSYFGTMGDLNSIFQNSKKDNKSEYDCILLFSGGKDSTFVLYKLIEMGLKVLAFTFDNGFISKTALNNIQNTVKELNIDHIIGTYDDMNKIFLEGLREESSVCNGCFKVLRILSTRLAYEKGIKYIVTGLSRGQIFELRLYDAFKQGILVSDEIEKRIFDQRVLYHGKDDYVSRVIGSDLLINKSMVQEIGLIDFYRYSDVTKEEIIEFLKSKSSYWNNPSDTGFCSSNCMINDVGIHIQRNERGYDNYTFPNSWDVRLGHTSIAEAKNESEGEVNLQKVQDILEKLGYNDTYRNKTYLKEYLVAYYTSDKQLNAHEIRAFMERSLPSYMIPTYFIEISKIPLNTNGKIAYNELPDPRKNIIKKYIAPRDETEVALEKIWCEILGIDKVGINEDFLQIGGHSLNIMQLISKVTSEFNVEIPLSEIFKKATIEELGNFIKTTANKSNITINKNEICEYYPATVSQKRMYALSLIKGAGVVQNILFGVRIKGDIDKERIQDIFRILIDRHEILRTHFEISNNEVVQVVHDHIDFNVNFVKAEKSEDEVMIDLIKPFNTDDLPLFRVNVIEVQKNEKILLLDMHHTISDGISIGIIAREFINLYKGKELPELRIQYKHYALWQEEGLKTGLFKKQEDYWLNLLGGEIPKLSIPTDYPKKWIRSFKGDTITVHVGKELASYIKNLATESGTTLYMLLLAVYNILLSKYTGQEDIIVGSISSGRHQMDLDNMVGMFLNNIVMRNKPAADKNFNDFLAEVKSNALATYENQDYPFELLVDKLGVKVGLGESPIFNTLFSLQNVPMPTETIDELTFEQVKNIRTNTSRQDISLLAYEQEDGIKLDFEYCSKLFNRVTIERMASDYLEILGQVLQDKNIRIDDIKLTEREVVL